MQCVSPQNNQQKRRSERLRRQVLDLRAALCPSSDRETLRLNRVQSEDRQRLAEGTIVTLDPHKQRGNNIALRVETVGKLRPGECLAVQPGEVNPDFSLTWADLTPPQRKALRKYRAGKKRERELALTQRQLRLDGERAEARSELKSAVERGDMSSIRYWRNRLDRLNQRG